MFKYVQNRYRIDTELIQIDTRRKIGFYRTIADYSR